jgi:hypothetical protein
MSRLWVQACFVSRSPSLTKKNKAQSNNTCKKGPYPRKKQEGRSRQSGKTLDGTGQTALPVKAYLRERRAGFSCRLYF